MQGRPKLGVQLWEGPALSGLSYERTEVMWTRHQEAVPCLLCLWITVPVPRVKACQAPHGYQLLAGQVPGLTCAGLAYGC